MRIIEFQAENFKKLKVVVIHPKGPLVELTGKNGSGKTSVLDGILYTLAGTENLPSQPIRRGADKGATMIDLGELRVVRRYTPTGSVLIVEGKKGERYQKPQQVLDKLFGDLTFDPLAFTRMKARDQFDELRRLVRLEVDPEALDKANEADYAARTIAGREAKALQAQVEAISIVADLPEQPIDITALITQLAEAGNRNTDITTVRLTKVRRADQAAEQRASAASLRDRAADLQRQATELLEQAAVKDETAALNEKDVAAMVIPEPIDTSGLRDQIENARATNAQIERRTQKVQLQTRLDEQRARIEQLSEAMKTREQTKENAIAKAEMPIPGLGFAGGEVMYNELPLNQASGAEQLRVSLAIAMAGNPELRVIRITDGSLLDPESLAIVKQMATDRDYQIWIERVDTSGKVGIVMEDGMVQSVNDEPEPEPSGDTAKKQAAAVLEKPLKALKTFQAAKKKAGF